MKRLSRGSARRLGDGRRHLTRSRHGSLRGQIVSAHQSRPSATRARVHSNGVSPSLSHALDACLEPVVGWDERQATGERLATVAAAQPRPARALRRWLVDAAWRPAEGFDDLRSRLCWSRRPLFIWIRLIAKVLVGIAVLCLVEYLVLLMVENSQ
jgi:hypothetical protein